MDSFRWIQWARKMVLAISSRASKDVYDWASTRNGMGLSLMSGISLSHLIFGWMDKMIHVFCLVGGTRMRGMRIII
jgi:hypothetical protein